jgi:NAD(P)-dependent dehydrogenase (short-subunit alcohol dehydrogenase family)
MPDVAAKVAFGERAGFTGRHFAVSGAGRGVGLAVAQGLLACGADVTALYRTTRPDGLDGLDGGPGRAVAVQLDVTDEARAAEVMREAHERVGRLDGLANVHGINIWDRDGSILEGDMAGWQEVLQTNLTGMANTARAAVPWIRKTGRGGAMVHFSSIQGLRGDYQPQDGYAVSKAAIVALSKSLAIQLAGDNIRSNAVLPGYIDTPMNDFRWVNEPGQKQKSAELVPLKRVGSPEEIANVCLFLLSDLAAYVTGTEIIADGGLTALPAVGA